MTAKREEKLGDVNKEPLDTSGMPNKRFSAERPDGSYSTLKIQRFLYTDQDSIIEIEHQSLVSGSVAAGVTQFPRHLIKVQGGKAVLKCHPISGHNTVYWYQQALGHGPQFLISFYEKQEGQKGNIPDRFSGKQFNNYSSELAMSALQLGDSAVYLCASSLDTALQGQ
ncbi:T-cell receptor beta chain T17T-22 [Myotis brandtii]|nr:T-cell receptor beta chain T17T-22 [Myotis brandtii]